jgi:hypothetical protein
MRSPTMDLTAGERARSLRLHPSIAHPITDPTDIRYGTLPAEGGDEAAASGRIVDPTDARCGQTVG